MKRFVSLVALAAALLVPSAAFAAEQTVQLSVANVSCASCAPIVRRTLSAIPGVSKVVVSPWGDAAVVTFEDQKTDVEALIEAVTNAGYPTKLASATTPSVPDPTADSPGTWSSSLRALASRLGVWLQR
jgi:mercuric ion binding protein